MEIKQRNILHNEFLIEVVDVNTNKVKAEYKAYNIILNTMFSRILSLSPFFNSIQFGTGTGELSKERTTLFQFLGSKTAPLVESSDSIDSDNVFAKRMIQIMPEEFVGSVITEVGVGYGNVNTNLCSHAFILDSQGNSVGITKSATDVINIYATVYMTFVTSHPNITISNTTKIKRSAWNNPFTYYLISQSVPSSNSEWKLGSGRSLPTIGSPSIEGEFAKASSEAGWIKNTEEKTLKTKSYRFDVNSGNGNIYEVGLSNFLRAKFPIPGIWEGYHFENKPLGIGNGEQKEFIVSAVENPRPGSIVVKSNNIIKDKGYREETYFNGVPTILQKEGDSSTSGERVYASRHTKDRSRIIFTSNQGLALNLSKETGMIVGIKDITGGLYGFSDSDITDDGRFIAMTCGGDSYSDANVLYKSKGLDNYAYEQISSKVGYGVPREGGVRVSADRGPGVKFSRDGKYLLLSYVEKIGTVIKSGQAFKYDKDLDTYVSCSIDLNGFPLTSHLLSIETTVDNRYFIGTVADRVNGTNLMVFEMNENGIKAVDKNLLFDSVPDIGSVINILKISDDGSLLFLSSDKDNSFYFYKLVDGRYILDVKYQLDTSLGTFPNLIQGRVDISPKNDAIVFCLGSAPYLLTRMQDNSFVLNRISPLSGPTGVSFNPNGEVLYISNYYVSNSYGYARWSSFSLKENETKVIFDTPPAEGEILTFDCDVDYIPKDTNSVLDLEVTIQFSDANEII